MIMNNNCKSNRRRTFPALVFPCTLRSVVTATVVASLCLLCVGAFSGRGGYTARNSPWLVYFGGHHTDPDVGKRLDTGADQAKTHHCRPEYTNSALSSERRYTSPSLWSKAESHDLVSEEERPSARESGEYSKEVSETCDELPPASGTDGCSDDPVPNSYFSDDDDEWDAFDLASTARGGGGRGWWFPGQRGRRRRNLARASKRANAKRASAAAAKASAQDLPTGLANQGNTCYLNSLLQTMYHAPGLKDAVLKAVDEGGLEVEDSVTVSALAKVFRQLDERGRAASTLPLTRAMGVDPRIQQDAQEFGRFLFMALEGEGGGSTSNGPGSESDGLSRAIQKLFAGRLVNYIECVDVSFSKTAEEVFYDLPLDVKGSGTLQQSLDRFTEAELLSGENRWRAGEHGLQDARKGVRFVEFPPVLQFHLKRFEYDPYRDDLAKIHDRLEFPTELDMSPWVDGDGGGDHDDDDDAASRGSTLKDAASHEYHLSAVVMHVGGPAAGHYYAYVRAPSEVKVALKGKETKKCTKWVKLDDQRVTEVSEAEVLRDAFGGGGGVYRGPGGQGLLGQMGGNTGGTASAYMLQYVRQEAPPDQLLQQEDLRESAQP